MSTPVFDGHNDLALRLLRGEDPSGPLPDGHLDLPRMREGGFGGGVFAVWVDPGVPDPLEEACRGVDRLRAFLEATPGIRPVLGADDLDAAVAGDEVAAVIGVEGGYGIRDDLAAVDRLAEAGVRCLTLTWLEPTAWADAAGAPAEHGGLTRFGRRVVERLHELGLAVDVSHASDQATLQAIEVADRPVIASHSGVRAVADHPRNLPDSLLESLASVNGVVGINFFPAYLSAAYARGFRQLRRSLGNGAFGDAGREALRESAGRELPPVPLSRLARHIEHAIRVAGEDAVGLGSDFDGIPALPDGMRDVRDLPALTDLLAGRGMPEGTLAKVRGDNFRRVFRAVLPAG